MTSDQAAVFASADVNSRSAFRMTVHCGREKPSWMVNAPSSVARFKPRGLGDGGNGVEPPQPTAGSVSVANSVPQPEHCDAPSRFCRPQYEQVFIEWGRV